MKRFNIDYIDKSGDLCHVWVTAASKEDAKIQARHEYWDIAQIISVH